MLTEGDAKTTASPAMPAKREVMAADGITRHAALTRWHWIKAHKQVSLIPRALVVGRVRFSYGPADPDEACDGCGRTIATGLTGADPPERRKHAKIVAGEVVCAGCGKRYPITAGDAITPSQAYWLDIIRLAYRPMGYSRPDLVRDVWGAVRRETETFLEVITAERRRRVRISKKTKREVGRDKLSEHFALIRHPSGPDLGFDVETALGYRVTTGTIGGEDVEMPCADGWEAFRAFDATKLDPSCSGARLERIRADGRPETIESWSRDENDRAPGQGPA